MSICQVISHEIMAFEARTGKPPALLILNDNEFREKFFAELYEFTMRTDGVDFKTPGTFMGVPFAWKDIWQYGGHCQWMLMGGGSVDKHVESGGQ